MDQFFRALILSAGYNTALVCIGATILGASAAAIGTFVLLRKRSLVSDAISHSTLPGLAIAFMIQAVVTGDGRFMPVLLIGATLSAVVGLFAVQWITSRTRLHEDAAIGSVLSVFFGLGIVLLTVIQTMNTGKQAGIASYLLGSTAGMLMSEVQTIAVASLIVGVLIFFYRRQFTIVCFDPDYASVSGYDVQRIDLIMMALLLAITVIGLKVAGLILIVALTIIPPVTARLWTDRSAIMVYISALFGGLSAYIGAAISSVDYGLPTGAVIVLVAFSLFILSLLFSPNRGVFAVALRRRRSIAELRALSAAAKANAGKAVESGSSYEDRASVNHGTATRQVAEARNHVTATNSTAEAAS